MTSTACDDQFAPEPGSREAAIDAMVMEVQPHEWRQGGAMRYQGHLITWGEYVQAWNRKQEAWHKAQDDLADAWSAGEKRSDRVAQSDASGDHYLDQQMVACACGDEYPADSYGAGFIDGAGECENCMAADDCDDWRGDTPGVARSAEEIDEWFQHHFPKQDRYQDAQGDDWIDEFARTSTPEEFRGAMAFSIGKYVRRMGKKDERIREIKKIADYANRWADYEERLTRN